MVSSKTLIRRTIKVIIWIILGIVCLSILLAVLIQIPSIQTNIVQKATTFVSNKTHTKVELERLNVLFPNSFSVKGLYLEDMQNDTLIYIGRAKVNMALADLFKRKISISSFKLDDTTVKLYNSEIDDKFSYDFLITALSDTLVETKTDTSLTPKWTFDIGKIKLQNIRVLYHDYYVGMRVGADVENVEFIIDQIDLEKSNYKIDELFINGFTAKVEQRATNNKVSSTSSVVLPAVSFNKLQLDNSSIHYADSVGFFALMTVFDHLRIDNGSLDIENELLYAAAIDISKSDIRYHSFAPELAYEESNSNVSSNWKVVVDKIKMNENLLTYQLGDKPASKNEFNADYLQFDHLSLEAENLHYDADLIAISVKQFGAIDQNGFEISHFSTDFNMDEHSITANRLRLNTPNSSLIVDCGFEFQSLDQLVEAYQFRKLNLYVRELTVKNSDVLYFSRALNKYEFFQNSNVNTSISGKVSGSIDKLVGKNLLLKTGKNTVLETDFNISGLPEMKTAIFDFTELIIHSGKKDLMMARAFIPENIELPENIDLQLAFKGTTKAFDVNAAMNSSFGDAELLANIDSKENFNAAVSLMQFDLGLLLKDTLFYGPLSLKATAKGQGLDLATLKGKISAEVTQLMLNKYDYQNLKLDGIVGGKQFDGTVSINDENVVFDFDGLVNLNAGHEKFNFKLNMLGVDLQKLHFADKDVRMSFVAETNFQGSAINDMNGTADISNIIVVSENKTYQLESLHAISVNEPDTSKVSISSALVGMEYVGNVSPFALPDVLSRFINIYFPVTDSIVLPTQNGPSVFDFEIQLYNHPILSDLLLPGLNEFIPGDITGSFDSEINRLKLDANISKIVYGTTQIKDFTIAVNSDMAALEYNISTQDISNEQMSLSDLLIDGSLNDRQLTATISSIDKNLFKKLSLSSIISKENDNYRLVFDPDEFYVMNMPWNISPNSFIEFGKQGFLIYDLNMSNDGSHIGISSVNNRFNDDLNIDIQNFKLSDFSGIVTKESDFINGTIDGNVLLKRVNDSYGIIADAGINDLFFRNIAVGNLSLKAKNDPPEQFNIDIRLSGAGNDLSAKGFYIPNSGVNSIDIKTQVESFSMKTIEAFSMGEISETSGTISGDIFIFGNAKKPEITGQVVFNDAFLKPAFLNSRIGLKEEKIQLKNDGIYFNNFTLTDPQSNTAILDGMVKMEQFKNIRFDFNVNSKDFVLINTTARDNSEFFGRMIIDSDIDVSGSLDLPEVNARLKMKKGSNFTFVVPEDRLTTDKGEDVVEFNIGFDLNPILAQKKQNNFQTSKIKGFDVSSIIEIDKEASLRLLMDPTSTDSLVVKGEAALGFNMDQSGMMSLTGAYNLSEGSYLVSLESIIKKKFDIERGSSIIWNGDLLDADININARYIVRASPYDLIADQLSGLSDVEKNTYKQRYPFIVVLKLRGKILQPEISFEIQLEPENKGIMSGVVDQKLSLLNEDPSGLNKQVFALLVLERFIQENPFETELGSPSAMLRTTVGKFLSAQLNQLSSKVIPGMEINFDIQSYDDFQSGQAEGRTQVEIGLKKQLFNERLSVQLGGTVDVEGEEAKHNSTSDIASDITLEYKLNKDGSFRLKGFRHDQYEGAIDGQLVETGVGVVYVHDFNRWKRKAP